jgi:phosphoglycerate dehydrogenase-like enzyme
MHPHEEASDHPPRRHRPGRVRSPQAERRLTPPAGPAVFLTDDEWGRRSADLLAAAPGIDPVLLVRDQSIHDVDLARIEVACFSADAWPSRAAPFFGVALRAPNLRWLHSFSAGTDSPVFASLLERGVRVTSSSGAAARPIAQSVAMYLLALSRDLPAMLRAQAEQRWTPLDYNGLEGQRILVVGYGPIGREVVRLAETLGMRPLVCRRSAQGDEPCEVRPLASLVDAVRDVDWVVVALPLTGETRSLIDADVLAAMKPGAGFVNVGRGELVDEDALVARLNDGHIGKAALDVFAVEPLPADSPLWSMPNVIVSPHSSGSTEASSARAAAIFVDNLGRFLRGESLANEVAGA